jgi:phosphatidylinositol alpha-1,6-mannosyltransferase
MNSSKTLLIFAYDFPPSSGGISRLCYEIAIGQLDYFNKIVVLTRKKSGEQKPTKQANFKLIELPAERLKCELKAIKIIKSFDKSSTTILCSLWYPEAFLALLSGHKYVYSLAHGAELQPGDSNFRKHFWHGVFAKYILRKINKVISNSHYTRSLVKQISKRSNCKALPLGVDIEQFKPIEQTNKSQGFVVGSLSRIHQFKGYDQVLEALLKLPEVIQQNLTWKIGGTGPYLSTFKEKIKNSAPNFKVEFLGFIPDENLAEYYNQLDVFVLFTQDSSTQNSVEGFGLVFLEAQACGTPVIGTNTGGIPDAIEHNNGGWLLEQDDMNVLSKQIEKLYIDKSLLEEQSVFARKRCVEKSSWELYNKKIFRILE